MTRRPARALGVVVVTLALAGTGYVVTRPDTPVQPEAQLSHPASPFSPSSTSSSSSTGPKPAEPVRKGTAPTPAVSRTKAVSDAAEQVERHGAAVRSAPGDKYRAVDAVADSGGGRHVRFRRDYQGMPVLGGDFVVHTAADGRFIGATVSQQQPIALPRAAKVSRGQAIAAAGLGRSSARQVVDAFAGAPVLAWEVTGATRQAVVDATTGRVRRAYDLVQTAEAGTGHGLQVGDVPLSTTKKDDGTYTLIDPDRGGNTVRDAQNKYYSGKPYGFAEFTDTDDVWGDGTRADRASGAVDVHYGLARTWDYFRDTFGRNGVGDDGKGLTAYVHYDVDEANASFSSQCNCLKFGDGAPGAKPFTSQDVVAHEMAHALTDATASLTYVGESGGLNEASSDIFGTLVEFAAQNPADPADYLVGEKTETRGPALRRMDEPNLDGKSVSCWSADLKDLKPDVHYLSGIGNKFFYNLAVGSGTTEWGTSTPCGSAGPVTGIGNDKAAQIWYRALAVYMVSNTNYAGARQATLTAAADLYGPESTEARTVEAAWLAVGVDGTETVPPAPSAPVMTQFPESWPLVKRIGDLISFQAIARDPQRQTLTYSATNLPPGVSIDPVSGRISGTITARGMYTGYVVATDPDGNAGRTLLFLLIKGAPVIRDVTSSIEAPVNGVANFKATVDDFADDWVDPYASVKVTVTGLPANFITNVGLPKDGAYKVTGGGIPKAVGSGTAVITATDADGEQASASIPWTITPPGPPGVPQAVAVTGGNGTAMVTWDVPQRVFGAATPTGYLVRVSPGTETRVDASARSLQLTGLDTRRQYTVGVRATSEAGTGPEQTVTLNPTRLTITTSKALTYGQGLTLSGQALRGDGGKVAGATVTLEQRPAGKTAWSRVTTVRTDAAGGWRYAVRPGVTTSYRVAHPGSAGMWAAGSAAMSASVRYTITAKAGTKKPKANKKIKISGTAGPARSRVVVTLQRKVGSRWVKVTSTRTAAKGAYSFNRAFKRGTWTLRVVIAGGTYNTTGTSAAVTLKVK
jgi:Zn-dependent metalloprotease